MKRYVYISLFALVSALTACSSLDESGVADTVVPADGRTIRMHTTIGNYTRMEVPSDNKTEWAEGDAIFFFVDDGDGEKGIKAVYDGAEWSNDRP